MEPEALNTVLLVALGLVGFIAWRWPDNPVIRFIYRRRGPCPRPGERIHRYTIRRLRHSALWLFLLIAVWAAGWWVGIDQLQSNDAWVMAPLVFVLPFLAAIALGCCVMYVCRYFWQRALKQNHTFDQDTGTFLPNKSLQPTRQRRAAER